MLNNGIIRELVKRSRPFVDDPTLKTIPELAGIKLPTDYSFASGHAMSTMALAVIIALFYHKRGWLALGYPLVVGISRICLCVHYTTDVLGGFAIGAVIAVAGYFFLNWLFTLLIKKFNKQNNKIKNEIIFDSGNAHKIKEVSAMLEDFKILSLKDIGFDVDIDENGNTTSENAEIKVRAVEKFCKAKGLNVNILADDSGLFIDALNGAPGVHSARYAADHSNEANRKKVLENLKGKRKRTAHFECTLCYLDEKGVHFFTGKTYGKITTREIGDTSFCYDCLFFSNDLNKTFGEATEAEKDSVSHRGRAIEELKKYLFTQK